MARFSLSALGADRPGIVAAVSGALGDAGCNLEDSTMTILQGHFAILLVVSADDDTTVASLEAALAPASEAFDLVIAVRPIDDAQEDVSGSGSGSDGSGSGTDGASSEALSISIHGADRPGIVHAISGALADAGGNVVDLSTQLVGETDEPVYVMTLRAIVAHGGSDRVAVAVKTTAEGLGVHCTVREDESDLL